MKRRRPLAAGLAVALAGLAQAQTMPEAPPAPVEPYRDRIIAPEQLQALPPDDDDEGGFDHSGPPRSLRVELGLSRNERADRAYDEQGLQASGFWESASLGDFSLDAGLVRSDRLREQGGRTRDWNGTATLWQRGLAFDGGWRVDNGMGVLNTPSLPLQREQARFLLPSVPFAGASTQWQDPGRGLQVQAAYGRAGAYTGTRAVGFEAADGHVATLGAQWRWAPDWTGAASWLATQGRLRPDAQGEVSFEPGENRALHLATGWRVADDALRFNLLASDGDRGGRALGAWLEGQTRNGRYLHEYGLYRLDPELAWGAYPIQSDVEGGYYRLDHDYGRWHWTAGADLLRPLTGGPTTRYGTGYLRYQATSMFGYGGGLNLRDAGGFAHSAQLFADRRSRWGLTRLQFDQARAAASDSWQVALDHAFALQQGARLSTSVAFGRLDEANGTGFAAASAYTTTLAVFGGRDITDRLALDGSARWTRGSGGEALRGLDLNLGLAWRLAQHWSLGATVYQSRGSRRSPFVLDPLSTRTPYLSLPRERSMLLTLRYDFEAGQARAIVGGPPGTPFGTVQGTVFLDENGDGVRAASELPAANITVLLDGRYSVRTDDAGRYVFPRVAIGPHTLSAEPDNLPLPWSFEGDNAQRRVEVGVRSDIQADLGARRPR